MPLVSGVRHPTEFVGSESQRRQDHRDADHRRNVLKQIFGVLLRRVERVDPDRDVVEGNDYIVLLSYDVVNL